MDELPVQTEEEPKTSAHEVEENPEDHIGVEVPDPWDDPTADEGWRTKPDAMERAN